MKNSEIVEVAKKFFRDNPAALDMFEAWKSEPANQEQTAIDDRLSKLSGIPSGNNDNESITETYRSSV